MSTHTPIDPHMPQTFHIRKGTSIQTWVVPGIPLIAFDFQHAAQTVSSNITVNQAEEFIDVLTQMVLAAKAPR